ncbi:NAD(P)/FAD-dependent oxidoreductase [Spirillospora sp. NPDC050679]
MAHRIVVLGAGYAGTAAATRLIKKAGDGVGLTVVNAAPGFAERPRLHQAATGQALKPLPLAGLFASATLVVGRADAIDLDARRVRVGERAIGYDTLVYALGSTVDTGAVPGIAEHAHTVADPAAAARLHEALAALPAGAETVVLGGGLCGIELATEIAERRPDLAVRLVGRGEPGGHLSPRGRRHLGRAFDRLGVRVRSGAEVVKISEGALAVADGPEIPFDLCVWAGGFTVPALAAEAGLAVDAQGRVLVDPTLRSTSHPEVHSVGDAAAVVGPRGEPLAYGCRTGGFTGLYAADAVLARCAGRAPEPFRFRYFHECVSLGRRDAVIQFLRADESPHRYALTGRAAVLYKELVLDSAKWMFRRAARG